MEFLQKLGPIDLVVVAILAAGVFAGFMAGMVRYALNIVVVIVAFIVAAQLRDPFDSILNGWNVFGPEMRQQLVFLILFVGLTIGGWFLVRIFWKGTRLPIAKQLDELGGAVLGFVFAALSIVMTLVVMDTFFLSAPDAAVNSAGPLKGFYDAMGSSVLVDFFRATLIPTLAQAARPLVPSEIAGFLKAP
ncbi:MAG TPA: CvpA family protein [Methylomirabilota bacterium]|nr:CvpA family protein [Methylomirabilota bacterium]